MSQLKRIEGYAKKLRKYCSEDDIDGEAVLYVVKDIGAELTSNISEDNVDNICSMLLKGDGPVHLFFRKCREATVGSLRSAVSEMLNILMVFLRKRRRNRALQKYAKDLMAQCQRIATGKAHGIVKALAIELLTRMVDKKDGFDTTDDEAKAIYDKFMEQYSLSSVRPTAKQRIIELLGTIAKNYPQLVDNREANTKLKRWCFQGLNLEMKKKFSDYEMSLVTGYLTCIDTLLYRQEEDQGKGVAKEEAFVIIQPQSPEVQQLFSHLLRIINDSANTNRYQAVIAALCLFKNHCEMFSNLLLDGYVNLYKVLRYWATHYNSTCYKFGLGAFEEFLRQLSVVLFYNIQGGREKRIARDLVAQFEQTLLKADSLDSIYEVSVAIRGVGYFSKVFYALEDEPDSNIDMYRWRSNLVRISNWFYSEANKNQKEYIRHLPAFIKAYTSFAEVQDTIPVDLMQTLQQMCDIFILSFVEMSGYHRRNGSFYIQQLFSMLYNKNRGVFMQFVDGFFEKALICTCTNINQPDKEDRPAYTELLYFWKVVLELLNDDKTAIKLESNTQKDDEDIEADDIFKLYHQRTVITNPIELSRVMYDTFISAILKLIKSFNLKLTNTASTEPATEMEYVEQESSHILSKSLRPINQKDFILFQNLVDFWCTLLKEIDNTHMIHWIHILSTQIIELSVIHPLVSGFYRILAEVLIICEQQRLFYGCKAYYSAMQKGEEIDDKIGMPQEYSSYLLLREYLKEVWHRLQQFTDELLASCLRLILAYPIEFFDIEELITPLEKALRLGITYHPLAAIAMNSLDKLLDPQFQFAINSKFLSRILPCINEYLLVGEISLEDDDSNEGGGIKKKKYKVPTASERRYQSVHIKMTSDQIGIIRRNYSTLPELQRRMMQFLGRLGGENKKLLISQQELQGEADTTGILSWDTTKKVKLRVPFATMKVDIYLDEYLPRICELAESSPDRKVKVAACELLHGLVVYMIGSSAFTPKKTKASEESDYHKFYLRIFPVMLKLAIDPDQVTRDMFRILNSQIIHWLTNNAHYENPETIALLQTFLDAACDTDAGLREYSTKCIQEFVEWSIKQTSRSTDNVHNIRSLLKRLYNLMASPSAAKRFGAALIFNNMYRFFREEETLVNMYTIEILGQLFLSLKIAEVDHPSIGTREQIVEAINHVKRILRQKKNLFMTDNDRRPFVTANEVIDLPTLIEWTFRESGSLQRTYAKVCINFFNEFAALLSGIKDSQQWLLKQDKNLIESVFLNERIDLKSETNAKSSEYTSTKDKEKDDKATFDTYLNWIKQMSTTIDGYIWLIERKIVDPQQLISRSLSSSRFYGALLEFLTKKPETYLEKTLDRNILEKGTVLSIYTHVAVRLVYFFDLVFNRDNDFQECFRHVTQHAAKVLFHDTLMKTVAETLLLPKRISERIQAYQGNVVTQSSTKRIYEIGRKFVDTINNKSCQEFREGFIIAIKDTICAFNIDLILRTENMTDRSLLIETVQSIDGIRYLQSIGLLDAVRKEIHSVIDEYPRDIQAYYNKLFQYFLNNCLESKDPLETQFMGSVLCICFKDEQFARNHTEELLAFRGPLEHLNDSEKLELFRKFDEYLVECIAGHFKICSRIFKANIDSTGVRDYLAFLFEYLKNNRLRVRKLVWRITDHLADDPSLIEAMVDNWVDDDKPLDLIVCLKYLFGADPGLLSRSKRKPIFQLLWDTFINFFTEDRPFKIKNSALDILPVFVCIDEEHTKKVAEVLQQTLVYNFPAKQSVEALRKGTEEYNNFISTLDKMMETMVTFKSVPLFDILKVTFVQERNHVHKEAITKNIEQFTKGLGLQSFLDITQFCFDYFTNQYYNLEHRKNLIEMVITFLSSASENFIVAFFKRNIIHIMKVIQQDIPFSIKEKIAVLHQKASCLRLIEAFYELLPGSATNESGEVNTVWEQAKENTAKDKRAIRHYLYDAYRQMRQEPLSNDMRKEEEEDRKAYLSYNRAVFNAFAAFAVRFLTKDAGFVKLFQKAAKGLRIWPLLVDVTQPICLKLELDQPLVKTRLQDLRAASGKSFDEDGSNITYMTSIALTGSSLTQSSFAEVVAEENTGQNETSAGNEETPSTQTLDEDTVMDEAMSENAVELEELEIDALNENQFMRAFTEIIQRLHNSITPPEKYKADDMPTWMQLLLSAFNEYNEDDNEDAIKYQVYIAKLITNYPFAFEKYAKHWMLPLMQFITKGDLFGSPINYLTQDLCIILIVWGQNEDTRPDGQLLSTKKTLYSLLVYLIKNAYHSSPRITRSNIQIIKGIFENWKNDYPIPTDVIYEQFHHSEGQENRNIVGLQVAGILYSNKRSIYESNEVSGSVRVDKMMFFEDLAANLKYKDRKASDIPLNAAELMGWTLRFLKENYDSDEENVRKMFVGKLEALFENKSLSRKHCLKCVNRAREHDIELGQALMYKATYRLGDYMMDDKAMLLDYINACWTSEYDEDMLYKLRQIGLLRMLSGRDEKLQLACLKVLNTLFPTIKKADVSTYLKRLVRVFPNHPKMECRELYYRFLKSLYESKLDPSLETDLKGHLFRGLIDRSSRISEDLFNFVKDQFGLKENNILITLQKLMSDLYVADTEDIYLLYATRIILNHMRETADFTEPLFDQPLDKTKRFDTEYKFNTAWYNTSSMMPLFADSQERSQLNIEDLELQLRQTQSLLEFSTTQGTGQTLISTFNPASQETQTTDDASGDVVMSEATDTPPSTMKPAKKESPYYNRRFLAESKGFNKRFHADRNEQLEKKMRNLLNSRKEAGEKKVSLTRTYRQGEIPDVQISRKDLLMPLEIIATADYNISRLLYSNLTVSILNEHGRNATEDVNTAYREELIDSIGKNLAASRMYFTPTIGSFLRIVFDLNAHIPSKVIKAVSTKSHNHHIGIAILEKQLINGDSGERPKKKASSLSPTKEQWIQLSLLYQSIDEHEIFQNLYLNNAAENEIAKEAITMEIEGKYAEAFNKFSMASDDNKQLEDTVEYQLWQEQMLFCNTQLTQWDRIVRDTFEATKGNWKSLWEDRQDPYLEYFVRGFSKFRIERPPYNGNNDPETWTKDEPNPLYKFLDDAYEDEARREKLLNDFACEWSFMEMYRKNYNRARLLISKAYDSMLSAWNTLHPLAHTSRLAKLSRLQRSVEIDDYLRLHKYMEDGSLDFEKYEEFVKALRTRYPDSVSDRMDTWYDILMARLEFFDDFLDTRLKNSDTEISMMRSAKNDFLSVTADACVAQGNGNVFKKLTKLFDPEARTRRTIATIRFLHKTAASANTASGDAALVKVFYFTVTNEQKLQRDHAFDPYEWILIKSSTFQLLKQHLVSHPNSYDNVIKYLYDKTPGSVDLWEPMVGNASKMANYLEEAVFEMLQEAGELLEAEDTKGAEYLWRFGKFCDDSLHMLNEDNSTVRLKLEPVDYGKIVVQCYFKAIDRDHPAATGNFPRLLELLELYPELCNTFRKQSRKLDASWKFIRWIPQLISSMASPTAPSVFVALERIAQDYPKALYYPMQVSYEFYELKKQDLSKETNAFVEKIMGMIRSPILEEFSNELKRLTDPVLILKDFMEFVRSIQGDNVPQSFIQTKYQEFHQLLLNNYSERLGAVQKKMSSKYASSLIRLFGDQGSRIAKFTDRDIKDLSIIWSKMKDAGPTESESKNLKAYSPWLHSFKNIEHDEPLEIPGQYTGLSKPYPELHVQIASIDNRILTMKSMRRPKRITFNGTDEREYHFLVKGGEDLRLDERIEQLFSIMNDTLRKNAFCSNQKIQMRTYKVVPMASNLGIIEWVTDTKPLRETIQRKDNSFMTDNAIIKYRNWIQSNKRAAKNMNECYQVAFSKPREMIVQKFEEARSKVYPTVLKDYLFNLASSPEAFIFLRKEFTYSLACISIYGYIVGIGDRHLDNFLLDLKSGRLIPIDFGYAFGAATELLPIPELVPFRLTRQLETVLEPLGISGILESAMTNILTAVQDEKELLMNVMSVFVKEPLVEWKRQAEKQSKRQRKERMTQDDGQSMEDSFSKEETVQWYPQRKISLVRKKLTMHNPVGILISDLESGHEGKPYLKHIVRIAKGVPGINKRADTGEICSSVTEQVRCLIDLATDPGVLGVAFLGWGSCF